MNSKVFKYILFFILVSAISSCGNRKQLKEKEDFTQLTNNEKAKGSEILFRFEKGEKHNHPTFALWLEDMDENYIQTLYVSKFISEGIFAHADAGKGEWSKKPGKALRPAALPVWTHKRNIKNEFGSYLPYGDTKVPDAYSGATPDGNFIMRIKTDKPLKGKYRIKMEINQPWDFNDYWHSGKHPDSRDYKSSCQPSLVYAVTINTDMPGEYFLNPAGHGHYAGENGKLYTDLSGFTTAFDIVKKVSVVVK